jgi:hypothetical protein
MDIQPLHTKIKKTLQATSGTIVLEDTMNFPRGESNLYLVSAQGKIIWKAEKPDPYTLYTRVRFNDDGVTLATYTLGSHACDLDLNTGKILKKTRIQ